jgi:hypothetical protein
MRRLEEALNLASAVDAPDGGCPHHILIKLVCRGATAAALPVAYGD